MKTTRKHIDSLVNTINNLTKSPASYMESGKIAVGHFHTDHAACYGGYQLLRTCNDSGAVTCPLGYNRHSASDYADMLRAFIAGLDFNRKNA